MMIRANIGAWLAMVCVIASGLGVTRAAEPRAIKVNLAGDTGTKAEASVAR